MLLRTKSDCTFILAIFAVSLMQCTSIPNHGIETCVIIGVQFVMYNAGLSELCIVMQCLRDLQLLVTDGVSQNTAPTPNVGIFLYKKIKLTCFIVKTCILGGNAKNRHIQRDLSDNVAPIRD